MKIFVLGLVLLVAACSENTVNLCPFITIPRDTAYVTQKVDYSDEFQVELIGFDGYCEQELHNKRSIAVVTPIFRVQRLRDSDETAVDVSFFTQAVKGPPKFLGKRSYSASTQIKRDEREKEFRGKSVKIRIPDDDSENFEILMGMDVSSQEFKYNQRTFDIKYQYEEGQSAEEVFSAQNKPKIVDFKKTKSQASSSSKKAKAPASVPAESGCSTCKAWNPNW